MTDVAFKSPKVKKAPSPENCEMDDNTRSPKKRRTAEDFFTFCNYILEYENYEAQKQEEVRAKSSSPLGSTGDSIKSESLSSSSSTEGRKVRDLDSVSSSGRRISCLAIHENGAGKFDDDSWDLVTCYCMKPFAGRPMIECSDCLTWVHLSCAKIRKSNIPEEFTCQRCKEAKLITRRSQRNRSEKRRAGGGFKGSRKRKWRTFPPFPKSSMTSDLLGRLCAGWRKKAKMPDFETTRKESIAAKMKSAISAM